MDNIYDVIFIGGGPASMSGSLYTKQMNMSTLIIEKGAFGGQIATTSSVENYLGVGKVTGKELCENMFNHIKSSGVDIAQEEVVEMDLKNNPKIITTHKNKYLAKTVVIGMGTEIRRLGLENENKYIGHGLSYSTIKDADKFAGKTVAVIGGGNSAIEDAIYLSNIASKVYLVHRRNEFRGDPMLVSKLKEIENIELQLECRPIEIIGEEVEKLKLLHIPTDTEKSIEVDGIFVAIGRGIISDIIDSDLERTPQGHLITNEKMETNIGGVFAIGDIRNTPFRQIITGCADGAISALSAFNYIKNLNKEGKNI